jgi:hypothetical protein
VSAFIAAAYQPAVPGQGGGFVLVLALALGRVRELELDRWVGRA